MVKALPQCVTGVFAGALGPEDCDQRLARDTPLNRDVDQQCQTQPLTGQPLQLDVIFESMQTAQSDEADGHGNLLLETAGRQTEGRKDMPTQSATFFVAA